MAVILSKALLFLPELSYTGSALVLLFVSLGRRRSTAMVWRVALSLAVLSLAAAAVGVFQQGPLFWGAYQVDLFSQIFKLILAAATALVFFICRDLTGVEDRYHPEFFMFLSTCTLGMMLRSAAWS